MKSEKSEIPVNGRAVPFTDEVIALIAARFKVLSEPIRLKLLIALKSGAKNVTELVQATGATQANVSRQLQILTHAGILERNKDGLKVYYAIADPTIFTLCHHVCGSLQSHLAQQNRIFPMPDFQKI